jgi:class 3 adenylate cyclase
MDVRCSRCGEDNPARARFCLACGSPIVPAADEVAGSIEFARESRRTLSVLFADVVGFTSLGERIDSESLRRVMDRFYAEMRGAVEAQGGTVAKFIGDAVMAVWGTPEVREDDALRAVRAADDMRAALRALNEDLDRRWGVRLGLRTGINTGEVVVDPAMGADLLVGDTLNVAARLEQAAADGDVLLGADTARLVRHEADLEPIAPLALKGKSRPLTAWRLRSARPGDRPRTPRLQAPLVGRQSPTCGRRSTARRPRARPGW